MFLILFIIKVNSRYVNSLASDPDLRLNVYLRNYLFLTVKFTIYLFLLCIIYRFNVLIVIKRTQLIKHGWHQTRHIMEKMLSSLLQLWAALDRFLLEKICRLLMIWLLLFSSNFNSINTFIYSIGLIFIFYFECYFLIFN